ncbi:MAG: response regulator transcription factor [Parabacteroides sp.]
MSTHLKVAIAEPSEIVRTGIESLLKRLTGFRLQLVEILSPDTLPDVLRLHHPDVLIINPLIPGYYTLQRLKEETGCEQMKCVALNGMSIDGVLLRTYDEQIGLFDTADEIRNKLETLLKEEPEEPEGEEGNQLSSREKEIVVCVVKGMTNREIADRLYLSTHTVITHRRNIARKLQIHSASGLTVYAIVNKLVELKDISTPVNPQCG